MFRIGIFVHVREPKELIELSQRIVNALSTNGYENVAGTSAWKLVSDEDTLVKIKLMLTVPAGVPIDVSRGGMYRSGVLIHIESVNPRKLVETTNIIARTIKGYPSELE